MVFITAGMGGGTGTGAAPIIAEIAKSIDLDNEDTKKILVVAIVTLPFSTEGKRRMANAQKGIEELSKHVDSILIINNDKLLTFKEFTLSRAFDMANDVLLTAAKGIAEIITVDGYVNVDFQDVNTVMEQSGTALMGAGSGKGDNRALDAIEAATTSVLLNDNDIRGARNVLIYYSYHPEHEITMEELREINAYLEEKTDGTADVIWGAGADESLDDELKITLIATGFEKNMYVEEEPKVTVLETPAVVEDAKPVQQPTANPEEITIIHRDEPAPQPAKEVVAPVVTVQPEPTATPVQPEPAAEEEKGRIFILEDDEPTVDEARTIAQAQLHKAEPVQDTMVADIHIVSPEPEPSIVPQAQAKEVATIVEEAPKEPEAKVKEPEATPEPLYRSAFRNDNDAHSAADRIKIIHEMLRNNPSGAEMAQKIKPMQMEANDVLYEGNHSSVREAANTRITASGAMAQSLYYNAGVD